MHLGKTVAQARRDVLTAWAAIPGDDGITPRAAVAGQLGLAWRRAELLGAKLRQQAEAADCPGGEAGVPGGLVGHTYSASAAVGGIYPVAERARALVELERAERELVVRFAETAHRMGIEEARVSLAEEQAALVVRALSAALARLGLDPQDPIVRQAVLEELRELTGGDSDGR